MNKRKWIWSFCGNTENAKNCVILETEKGDGREYMFAKYGRENCCMSYLYELGKTLIAKYNWQVIEEVVL